MAGRALIMASLRAIEPAPSEEWLEKAGALVENAIASGLFAATVIDGRPVSIEKAAAEGWEAALTTIADLRNAVVK